jgi:hypothetical protein
MNSVNISVGLKRRQASVACPLPVLFFFFAVTYRQETVSYVANILVINHDCITYVSLINHFTKL